MGQQNDKFMNPIKYIFIFNYTTTLMIPRFFISWLDIIILLEIWYPRIKEPTIMSFVSKPRKLGGTNLSRFTVSKVYSLPLTKWRRWFYMFSKVYHFSMLVYYKNFFYICIWWFGLVNMVFNATLKLYHIMLYGVQLAWVGFELTMLVVIVTDCLGSCKSNYHTITKMTAPNSIGKTCHSETSRTCILQYFVPVMLQAMSLQNWN